MTQIPASLPMLQLPPSLIAFTAHEPPLQVDSWQGDMTTGHAFPQAPQLAVSVATDDSQPSGLEPLQSAYPLTHTVAQVWAAQTARVWAPELEQTELQAPQFLGSSSKRTQSDPHAVVPPTHTREHWPIEHTCPSTQAFPQAPQFWPLDCVSTHRSPQSSVPGPHAVTQAPLVHAWPSAQTWPQLPQWRGSSARLTHKSPQAVVPSPQLGGPLRPSAFVPLVEHPPPSSAKAAKAPNTAAPPKTFFMAERIRFPIVLIACSLVVARRNLEAGVSLSDGAGMNLVAGMQHCSLATHEIGKRPGTLASLAKPDVVGAAAERARGLAREVDLPVLV